MKFFILDDDPNIVHILKMIIEDKDLGNIIGEANDGTSGIKKIKSLEPDIVLIDLLMPDIDGLTVVKEIKKENSNVEFIMISQVYEKNMVERAYKYGVEYYIYKPINAIEVQMIIKKVIDSIETDQTLSQVREIIHDEEISDEKEKQVESLEELCRQRLNHILINLGIIGESGTGDIVKIIKYSLLEDVSLKEATMSDLCSVFTDNPRSMEQRIRRAIKLAMTNIANLGIEDYINEVFVEYANSLFNFEQVRKEMEFIRGNSKKGGSANIKKFLIGLETYCKYVED